MLIVLALGLISKLSFCTSCVIVWREATDDDETDEDFIVALVAGGALAVGAGLVCCAAAKSKITEPKENSS